MAFSATPATLGVVVAAVVQVGKLREHLMRVFRLAAVFALLAGPAYAQLPPINLIQDGPGKTPEQKAADAARDKAYKESLRKIPDAKAPSDPWGNVRGGVAAKTATSRAATSRASTSKTSTSKTANSRTTNSRTAASVKPRNKTGTDAD
jgi:hypothetical protein